MAKIPETSLQTYADGDKVYALDYNRDREVIRVAINDADDKAINLQTQLNTLVVNGESSLESAQARVEADGTVNATLKDRLDKKELLFSTQIKALDKIALTTGQDIDAIIVNGNYYTPTLIVGDTVIGTLPVGITKLFNLEVRDIGNSYITQSLITYGAVPRKYTRIRHTNGGLLVWGVWVRDTEFTTGAGWAKFNEIIHQWGYYDFTTTNGSLDYILTFPTPFPTVCCNVSGSISAMGHQSWISGGAMNYALTDTTAVRFVHFGGIPNGPNYRLTWSAIGY